MLVTQMIPESFVLKACAQSPQSFWSGKLQNVSGNQMYMYQKKNYTKIFEDTLYDYMIYNRTVHLHPVCEYA